MGKKVGWEIPQETVNRRFAPKKVVSRAFLFLVELV